MAAKRVRIVSCKLVRECPSLIYPTRKISGPEDAFELSRTFLEDADREMMLLVCLNRKGEPTDIQTIAVGTISSAPVHPREIFKTAILANSSSIILVHNHPSGDPAPSREDIDISHRIKEVGNIIGIELLDHIIIGNNCYRSLKSMGQL